MRTVIVALIAGASAVAAQADTGQGQTATAPTVPPPTTIVFSDKGPSTMSELPMGIHRIPDSNVFISGHQKGGLLGLALFGVVGMLAQSTVNADAGAKAVGNVQDQLRFDVTAKASELTRTIAASDAYRQKFTLAPGVGGGTLAVVPYVVITFVSETDIRPFVVLKSKLASGQPGTSSQMTRYFCCEGEPLPLTGANGVSENNGERLKEILTAELETAINVMLLDRSQPYSRVNLPKVTAEGSLPFIGKSSKVKGYEIGHYRDNLLFETPGAVFGGVHIAEPGSLDIKAPPAK